MVLPIEQNYKKKATSVFVHWASHNLNLVLNDSVKHLSEASR